MVVEHLSGAADKKALRSVCRGLRAVVDSKVSKLELSIEDVTPNDLDRVAAQWPALRVLHLPELLPAAAPALGRATFASMEELQLSWTEKGLNNEMALAAAVARMPKLRVLNFFGIRPDDAGVQALVQVECPSLEEINLLDSSLDPGSIDAIAGALSKWPKIRILVLDSNPQVGDAGAEALCRAAFPCMEELHLENCGLGSAGAQAISIAAAQWPVLRVLDCMDNALGPEGVAALLSAPLPALEELDLESNEIGEKGAAAIAAASHRMPQLRVLRCSRNDLGAAGARALAQAHFPQLESLDLRVIRFGEQGKAALAAARLNWPKFREVLVSGGV